jgi:hypothetical protein
MLVNYYYLPRYMVCMAIDMVYRISYKLGNIRSIIGYNTLSIMCVFVEIDLFVLYLVVYLYIYVCVI